MPSQAGGRRETDANVVPRLDGAGAGMSGAERILLNVGAVSSALTLMAVAFVAAFVMRLPT
jgi:hypothetical protein